MLCKLEIRYVFRWGFWFPVVTAVYSYPPILRNEATEYHNAHIEPWTAEELAT